MRTLNVEVVGLRGLVILPKEDKMENELKQLTCERCGNKTDAGAWLGFVYVGAECLTSEDKEYIDE